MAAGFLKPMKNFLKNTNLKIIAATSVTIFSLLVVFVGTFAWFQTTLNQEGHKGDDFEISVLEGRLKNIYFHKSTDVTVNQSTGKPTSFTFNPAYCGKITYNWATETANYSGDTSISLDEYTPLDHDHPLLMVFELDNAYASTYDGEIFISAKTSTAGFLGARDNSSIHAPVYGLTTTGVYQTKTVGTTTNYYYALSSVANFYCTDSNSELYNKDEEENNTTLVNSVYAYADLRNRDQSIAARKTDPTAVVPDLSFTSINNSDETSSFKQNPTIYTSKINTNVKYICVILDYYSDAVEYIYSTFLGNDTLEYTFHNELNFLCDWGLEVC